MTNRRENNQKQMNCTQNKHYKSCVRVNDQVECQIEKKRFKNKVAISSSYTFFSFTARICSKVVAADESFGT